MGRNHADFGMTTKSTVPKNEAEKMKINFNLLKFVSEI